MNSRTHYKHYDNLVNAALKKKTCINTNDPMPLMAILQVFLSLEKSDTRMYFRSIAYRTTDSPAEDGRPTVTVLCGYKARISVRKRDNLFVFSLPRQLSNVTYFVKVYRPVY